MDENSLTEEIRKFKAVTNKYKDLLYRMVESLKEKEDES